MAKWEERVIADKILDVLYDEVEAGRISKPTFRRLQTKMGEFFNIPDLIRRKTNKEFLKLKFKQKLEAERKILGNNIPGGKPGENVVAIYEGFDSKYLKRKKGKI